MQYVFDRIVDRAESAELFASILPSLGVDAETPAAELTDAEIAEAVEIRDGYRSTNTCRIFAVYFPRIGRASIVAGGNPEWTDATSATDALERYLEISNKPLVN